MTTTIPIPIICCDCGVTFFFTEGEQKFYAEKKFEPPKRCKDCRQAKRERKKK